MAVVRKERVGSGARRDITFFPNCRPLPDFGVFRELHDVNYFRRARAELGTVVWPHEQDICPDTLYLDSKNKRKPRPVG